MASPTAQRASRAETVSARTWRLPAFAPLEVLRSAAVAFWRDNAVGMAGMIAFFGFLSAIPLALILLAVLGNVLGGVVSPQQVRHLFSSVTPGLSQHDFLKMYWDPVRHSRVATTILGVVGLLLGTTGLHDSVDWAINRIWRSPETRPFWISKLRGLAVSVWGVAFVVVTLSLTWLWAQVLGLFHAPSPATALLAFLPSLVVDMAIFTALYKLTPMVHVKMTPAILAGFFTSVLWALSKYVFGWWVVDVGTYNRVYGPLAASIIVMLWLWISAMIFLFGAEISVIVQRRSTPEPQPDPQRVGV